MSDYTPTTDEVRNQWACEPDEYAEFDRWLASVKAEAVAEYRAEVRKQEREETAKVLRNWAKHLTGEASK